MGYLMNYPIIIIGGGKGTRMSKYMPGIPKLLLPLGEDEDEAKVSTRSMGRLTFKLLL